MVVVDDIHLVAPAEDVVDDLGSLDLDPLLLHRRFLYSSTATGSPYRFLGVKVIRWALVELDLYLLHNLRLPLPLSSLPSSTVGVGDSGLIDLR
ncbi:hypothetical protein GUJ93_ZPchr0008g11842 [Zizania palustris]|uniref:Uncharacterized protein n=1 Tax=Zizania palustris TaxID=103762 RepID=A0A8J5RZF5_ZIZPA|nr:hypothetical protein GUJ93_ZPchr0008g11842 [Zizania palustris]